MADKPSKGLADIIAASTALGDTDGRALESSPFLGGEDVKPVFSASRMGGWTAAAMERHAGRLIRPGSEHAGGRGLTWTPLDRP